MNDQNIHDQIDRINSQIESGEEELADYTSQKDELDDSISEVEQALKTAQKESSAMTSYIEACQQEIESCKADIIEYMHESGNLQAKVGRYDAMLENINFRKTQLNQRLLQFKSDDAGLEAGVKVILAGVDSATDQLAQNQNRNKTNRELIHNTNEKLSATES